MSESRKDSSLSHVSRAPAPARANAPAKINLGLFVGPVREADGRHELASVMQSISLADELTLEPAAPPAGPPPADGLAAPAAVPASSAATLASVSAAAAVSSSSSTTTTTTGAPEDEVVCPGVPGPPGENLAAAALRMFRAETGWDSPSLRLKIDKRIPVAAGLGGGSADAAATLRLARHVSGLGSEELLADLAARLGADVPAQIAPGRWLASGAGERLCELAAPNEPFGVLVLPAAAQLSAGAVYARLDELRAGGGGAGGGLAGYDLGLVENDLIGGASRARATPAGVSARGRSRAALNEVELELRRFFELSAQAPEARGPHGDLLHNDLQVAAISLCPEIEPVLAEARAAGADVAFVSGSGPTVVGLFLGADGPARARRAAAGLGGREPAPICAEPVDAAFGRAHDITVRHNLGR